MTAGVAFAELTCFVFRQRLFCFARIQRRVDLLQGIGHGLTVFVIDKGQGIADEMHDAGLMDRGRKHRCQRLGHALEAIRHGNNDVFCTPILEFTENIGPIAGAFILMNP